MPSIFSRIIKGEIPSFKIAEDNKFYAFLDIHPKTKGHTLVVPKEEKDYLFDLSDDTLKEMICFSKKIACALKETYPCERVALLVLGLEVPHAHIHLIPIKKESDIYQKTELILTEEEFEETAANIRQHIK